MFCVHYILSFYLFCYICYIYSIARLAVLNMGLIISNCVLELYLIAKKILI